MSAWMRMGWTIVAVGWILGSSTQAGVITGIGSNWKVTGDFSLTRVNQTTAPPGPTISAAPITPTPISIPPPAAPIWVPPVTPVAAPITPTVTTTTQAPVFAAQVIPVVPTTTATTITTATPIPAPTPAPTPVANAFINLGNGPYPDASTITSGNAQPWYNSQSQALTSLFGGNPTPQQEAAFSATVMQRVQETFALSGVNVSLTSDPNAPAAHTLSLVSNTSAQLLPSAIGMTYVGGNGFSFIDQQAPAAQTLDQLEWLTAHNIAHELMLAFGVGENYDQTGNFIDARNALWSMLTSPTATFSPAAAAALNQALTESSNTTAASPSAQVIDLHPVPEPTTLLLWTCSATAVVAIRSRRGNKAS